MVSLVRKLVQPFTIAAFLVALPHFLQAQASAPHCDSNGLDQNTFTAVVTQRMSALLSPETEGVPGTFLGVDLKDADASAAVTFGVASSRLLTISAHGGVHDGIVAVVKDATLNPEFGTGAQLHFQGGAHRALQYTTPSCDALELAVRNAQAAYALRMAEIRTGATGVQRRLDRGYLAVKAAKIDSALRAIPTPASAADSLRRDSLRVEFARLQARREWLDSIPLPDPFAEALAARNALAKAYDDARQLLDLRGFSFDWWSVGIALDNTQFDLFNPAAALDVQLSKRTYLTRAATLTYSRIWQSPFKFESRYLAISTRVGWEDNLGDLNKVDVTDRTQYAPPPSERMTEKKATGYEGYYQDNLRTIHVTADYYQFLVSSDRFAVHIFSAFAAKGHQTGEVAFGAGLLLSARNPAKKTSVANSELFFSMPDLGNVRHSNEGRWRRGTLGLQVTFPINFAPGS